MACLPGFLPVVNPVHETDEIVGIDERIGASVPPATMRARFGMIPRAIRSCTSGSPTPSSPMTATRGVGADPSPRRLKRSSSPTPGLDLFLGHSDDFGHGGHAGADAAPAVVPQRAHALL